MSIPERVPTWNGLDELNEELFEGTEEIRILSPRDKLAPGRRFINDAEPECETDEEILHPRSLSDD